MSDIFDIQHMTPVIQDLIHKDKRPLVFEILDMYFGQAESVQDFDTLGYLSQKADHRQLYMKCAEAAYVKAETPQQKYIARANLYKAYNALNEPDQALFYIELNLSVTPDDFETLTQKAFNLALKGQKDQAEALLLDLIKKHPEKEVDLQSALSGKWLREGKLSQGIKSFLGAVKPKSGRFETHLKMKRWQGTVQPGKTLYVEGEGGIGDELINIRFFDHVKQLGMTPVLYSAWSEIRQDVVQLFRRLGHQVLTEPYSIDRNQLWCPMMSLPALLNLTEDQLWTGVYLHALDQPKNKLQGDKFRIGIKCSGNPYFSQDEYRKIPLEIMLQYLPEQAEIYYIDKQPGASHARVTDLHDRISSWEDTLDFINQMDCIVSSCTSLVHAAGAMGKPTFVIVPIAEYYIWTTSSRTTCSPWYGENFHVFKQSVVKSWHEPLMHMQQQLRRFQHEHQSNI